MAVTAVERTPSIDALGEFEVGMLRPGALVRSCELADAGIAPAELDGGILAFGGRYRRSG